MLLAATTEAGIPPVICTLLLVATIVLFVIGITEALRITSVTGSRYGALVGFLISLVLYVVLC